MELLAVIRKVYNSQGGRSQKVGKNLWSARVTGGYRALALKKGDDYYWIWIGNHDEYESLLN